MDIRRILGVILFVTVACGSIWAQTLHALIACDTEDEKIGASVNEDLGNMETFVSIVAAATGLTPSINFFTPGDYYFDKKLDKDVILGTIEDLNLGSEDVVFFYYSGHGARPVSSDDPYPQMALSKYKDGFLPLSAIREKIDEKNPKFSVVMGDLCNNILPGLSSKSVEMPKTETRISDVAQNNLQSLFTDLSGKVTVCSSQPGKTSIALKEGGAFTLAFFHVIDAVASGEVQPSDWKTLLSYTGELEKEVVDRMPYYEIDVRGSDSSRPQNLGPAYLPDEGEHADRINALLRIADSRMTSLERINMQDQTISSVFDSPNAKVEIVGRNGKTILDRVRAVDYISRICTIKGLAGISLRDFEKSEDGKYNYIKIHEIYRE